jgi:hypothetical protein
MIYGTVIGSRSGGSSRARTAVPRLMEAVAATDMCGPLLLHRADR